MRDYTEKSPWKTVKGKKGEEALTRFNFAGILSLAEQCGLDSTRWFPELEHNIANTALCIAGEVGEVANIVKKVERGTHKLEDVQARLAEEIVDVQIYMCKLIDQLSKCDLDIDWAKVWMDKRTANEERFGKKQPEGKRAH